MPTIWQWWTVLLSQNLVNFLRELFVFTLCKIFFNFPVDHTFLSLLYGKYLISILCWLEYIIKFIKNILYHWTCIIVVCKLYSAVNECTINFCNFSCLKLKLFVKVPHVMQIIVIIFYNKYSKYMSFCSHFNAFNFILVSL